MIRLLSSRLSTTTRVCVQAHTPVASTFRSSAAAFGEGRRWCVLSRRDAPTLFRALETTNEEIGDAIRRKITEGLSPDRLQVIDTSGKALGRHSAPVKLSRSFPVLGGCGSFFIVRVESNEFEEKSMGTRECVSSPCLRRVLFLFFVVVCIIILLCHRH